MIEWGAPTELAGNLESELTYYVTYCTVNLNIICQNTSIITNVTMEITGLTEDTLYQFTVHVLNKEDVEGLTSRVVLRTQKAGMTHLSGFNNSAI